MNSYQAEGIFILYAVLLVSQVILAILAASGRLSAPGMIMLTLRYLSLAAVFLFSFAVTMRPPLLDDVSYRWLLRGSYVSYFLLCVWSLAAEAWAKLAQMRDGLPWRTAQRAKQDVRRGREDVQRAAEDSQRETEDAADRRHE